MSCMCMYFSGWTHGCDDMREEHCPESNKGLCLCLLNKWYKIVTFCSLHCWKCIQLYNRFEEFFGYLLGTGGTVKQKKVNGESTTEPLPGWAGLSCALSISCTIWRPNKKTSPPLTAKTCQLLQQNFNLNERVFCIIFTWDVLSPQSVSSSSPASGTTGQITACTGVTVKGLKRRVCPSFTATVECIMTTSNQRSK